MINKWRHPQEKPVSKSCLKQVFSVSRITLWLFLLVFLWVVFDHISNNREYRLPEEAFLDSFWGWRSYVTESTACTHTNSIEKNGVSCLSWKTMQFTRTDNKNRRESNFRYGAAQHCHRDWSLKIRTILFHSDIFFGIQLSTQRWLVSLEMHFIHGQWMPKARQKYRKTAAQKLPFLHISG